MGQNPCPDIGFGPDVVLHHPRTVDSPRELCTNQRPAELANNFFGARAVPATPPLSWHGVVHASQCPLKRALRFSRNAEVPSRMSSLANTSAKLCVSKASP